MIGRMPLLRVKLAASPKNRNLESKRMGNTALDPLQRPRLRTGKNNTGSLWTNCAVMSVERTVPSDEVLLHSQYLSAEWA